MLQTVLAGSDPSQPAIDQLTGQPLTIEELLRRRGLLAVGGNSRMMPLGDAVSTPNPGAATVSASGAGSSSVSLPAATTGIPVAAVDPNAVPGAVVAPPVAIPAAAVENDTQADTNDLQSLLAGMGVAGGSLAAAALLNRMRNGKTPKRALADTMNKDGAVAAVASAKERGDIPTGRATPIDLNAARIDRPVTDGEFRVVDSLTRRRGNATSNAGPAKLNSATVTEDRTVKGAIRKRLANPNVVRLLARPR